MYCKVQIILHIFALENKQQRILFGKRMKRIILLIVALATAISQLSAARTAPVTGRVVDEQGAAIEWATVVLLRGTEQAAGAVTDDEGRFALKVAPGAYTLSVQYLGFEPASRSVRIADGDDLGDIVLKASATQIESVEVKAQLIRREADRFVVDVANAPSAIGQNGTELLERAPGVWIDGERITINGKSGSKVFVNDRELRMEPEQLLAYLRALRAEEIQKIEVVPVTGADHDADASGGIIRITLRKRREEGMQGSLSMQTSQSRLVHAYAPGGNISYHRGRLDLNASGWGWLGSSYTLSDERTRYTETDKLLRSRSDMVNRSRNGGGTVGVVYELNDRHSLGAEFSYFHSNEPGENTTSTDLRAEAPTRTDSRYESRSRANGYEATFNYIWKIDTLGSVFKVLGDYAHRTTRIADDNRSRIVPPAPAAPVDSLFRDRTRSSYDVAALTLALEKRFSPRWMLKAGTKYTRNEMRNDARYEYFKEETWLRNDPQSFEVNYTEHIAALYGVVTASLGRWSAVAGLRGEYTHTTGKWNVGQDYFSLFPNANLSYALTKDGAYSLVAQYARTIERPRFWCLTPQRSQLSDYTYQIGNPRLDPAYRDDISLTLVLNHKYTFTGGLLLQRAEIDQTILPDADNPDMLGIHWVNYDATTSYYATASLPFQPAKWMTLNVNATYMRRGQRLDRHAPETRQNVFMGGLSTTFTLPAKFYIDLSYRFQSSIEMGNVRVEPMHFLNAGVKKRFGERFTATFSVNGLLDQSQKVVADGAGFVRRMTLQQQWCNRSYRIGLTYNFKAGKAFRAKKVEAGAAEDKGRL